MAIESPHVRASNISASEYPDLVRRYQISGVPKTIVNDRIEILGALPEHMFVSQALTPPDAA